jgi:autotransporter-associated beta strand protein
MAGYEAFDVSNETDLLNAIQAINSNGIATDYVIIVRASFQLSSALPAISLQNGSTVVMDSDTSTVRTIDLNGFPIPWALGTSGVRDTSLVQIQNGETVFNVASEADLRSAVTQISDFTIQDSSFASGHFDIDFQPGTDITLTSDLPAIDIGHGSTASINGNGGTVDLNNFAGLQEFGPDNVTGGSPAPPVAPYLAINDLTVVHYLQPAWGESPNVTITVATQTDLANAIAFINANDYNFHDDIYNGIAPAGQPISYTIALAPSANIQLTSALPEISLQHGSTLNINRNGGTNDVTITVATQTDLANAITFINANDYNFAPDDQISTGVAIAGQALSYTIALAPGANIQLTSALPAISLQDGSTLNISGNGGTIDLNNFSGLNQVAGAPITINNVTVKDGSVLLVKNEADLVNAITQADNATSGNYVITLLPGVDVKLNSDLPAISLQGSTNLTILGNGGTIDGQNQFRGLMDLQGSLTVDNLNFDHTAAIGGAGGDGGGQTIGVNAGGGGGGGAGLGGGLFVGGNATVSLNDVHFINDSAVGGHGGRDAAGAVGVAGGGGGGMGGNGGSASVGQGSDVGTLDGGGGGGGLGVGANGGTSTSARDGGSGIALARQAGGSGGTTVYAHHVLVDTLYDYNNGGVGGQYGGGGGWGYGIGGGGGGINGQSVDPYSLGGDGFSLTLSPLGLATDILTIAAGIALPGAGAVAFSLVANLATYLYAQYGTDLGAPGYTNKLNITFAGNGGGVEFGSQPGTGSRVLGGVLKAKTAYGLYKDGAASAASKLKSYGLGLSPEFSGPDGNPPDGGNGGFGGGGGGGGGDPGAVPHVSGLSGQSSGGWGGFGGGGGGAGGGANVGYYGGWGGFGGGAGAGAFATGYGYQEGRPGFGGGYAIGSDGGGGAGLGGNIFVQAGGKLTLGSGVTADGGTVTGGGSYAGGFGNGDAYGAGIFFEGKSALNLAPAAGQVVTVGDIADQGASDPLHDIASHGVALARGTVVIDGPGVVQMSGTNTYLGGTFLQQGTLELTPGASLNPYGTIYTQSPQLGLDLGPTLKLDAGVTLTATIDLTGSQSENLLIDNDPTAVFASKVLLSPGGSKVEFTNPVAGQQLTATNGGVTYFAPTIDNGALRYELAKVVAGAPDYAIGSTGDLSNLLAALGPQRAASSSNPNLYEITLLNNTGTFAVSSLVVPTLSGNPTIFLENPANIPGGGAADPLTAVSLTSGTITFNPTTPVVFVAGQNKTLTIGAMLNQVGGRSGFSVEGAGRVRLTGINNLTGTIVDSGTLEITNAAAAGKGTIEFLGGSSQFGSLPSVPGTFGLSSQPLLILDGTTLPSVPIANFRIGDTIDLTNISASGFGFSDATGALSVGSAVLHFASDLAAGNKFAFTADGHGGTDVTLISYQLSVATASDLSGAIQYQPGLAGIDIQALLMPASGLFALSSTPPTIARTGGGEFTIVGNGDTIDGQGHSGYLLTAGTLALQDVTLRNFSGPALVAAAGTSTNLLDSTVAGEIDLALNAGLVLESGSVGAISAPGGITIDPLPGETATLNGAVTGSAVLGNPNAVVAGAPTLLGGTVEVAGGASISSNVTIETDTALELQAGATVGGTIALDSPVGAVLRLDGSVLPGVTIALTSGDEVIDLPGLAVGSAQTLTVGPNLQLSVPGLSGELTFAGGVTSGERFLLAPDGQGGSELVPLAQTATVTTETQLAQLTNEINALPAGDGLSFSINVGGIVGIAHATPVPASGVNLSLTGTGGFALGSGAALTLAGTNTFSGGLTLGNQSTLEITSPGAAGTGAIQFAGPDATLRLDGTLLPTDAIEGLVLSDTIDLANVAPTQSGPLLVDFNHQLAIPTSTGTATLSLPELSPFTAFATASDGHGGLQITQAYAQQTIVVANEAQLDRAIQEADASPNETTVIRFAQGVTITLSQVLPAIQTPSSVLIDGNGGTLDGNGAWGGLVALSGVVGVENLTIRNAVARGGNGVLGSNTTVAGGGGAGLGGGLFVGSSAQVSLQSVNFLSDAAIGGAGSVHGAEGAFGIGDANTGAAGIIGDGGFAEPAQLGGGLPQFGGGASYGQTPGFGGGGTLYGGGGGLGAGGAIFVQQNGQLTLFGGSAETGGSVQGGSPGGAALGAAIFGQGSIITLSPGAGQLVRIADAIADQGPSGPVGLLLNGAGTVELDGANSYSGTTKIASGTLVLTGSLNGLAGTIEDDSKLVLSSSASTTLASTLSGSSSVAVNTAGTLTLSGSVALGGTLAVQSGALVLSGSFAAGMVTDAGVITVVGSSPVTTSLTGGAALTDNGTGLVSLAAGSSLGSLTVNAGELVFQGSATGPVTVNGGTLALDTASAAGPITLNGGEVVLGVQGADSNGLSIHGAGATVALAAGVLPTAPLDLAGGDFLDLQGVTGVTSASVQPGNTLNVVTASGTIAIALSPTRDYSSLVVGYASDGTGGTTISFSSPAINIANVAAMDAAIAAIAPGGSLYAPGAARTFIGLPNYATATSPLQPIILDQSQSLTFANGLVLYGGFKGYVFDVRQGSVHIGGALDLDGLGLNVEAAGTLEVDSSQTSVISGGVTVDGTLLFNGSAIFEGPLTGSGHIVFGGARSGTSFSAGSSFTGTVDVNGASVWKLGNGFAQLNLNSGFAEVTASTGTVTFGANLSTAQQMYSGATAGAVLEVAGTNANFTVHNFSAGDVIEINDNGAYITSLQLSASNLLTATLSDGSADRFQLDPTANLSRAAIGGVGTSNIRLTPFDYTVTSGTALQNAFSFIDNYGVSASGVNYTITVNADFSEPSTFLGANYPQYGDSLLLLGQGHTIQGNSSAIYSDSSWTISNLTLISENLWLYAPLTIGDNVNLLGGSIHYGSITATPDAGTISTLGTPLNSTSLILNGPGTLRFSGGNAQQVTIDQGTLELNGGSFNTVQFNGNGTLRVDGSSAPASTISGLGVGVGTIDFAGIAPGALSLQFVPGAYTIVGGHTRISYGSPLVALSDGAGGTLVYAARSSFTATDETSLNTELASIAPGGSQFVAGLAETITLAPPSGTLALASLPYATTLDSSTKLTLHGGSNVIDGGSEPGLSLNNGTIALDSITFTDFASGSTALSIGGSAAAALNNITFTNFASGSTALLIGGSATTALSNITFTGLAAGATGLKVGGSASATLTNVNFAGASASAPVLNVGAGDTVTINSATFASGETIELGAGADLKLTPAAGGTLAVAAALDDPTGDGTGTDSGTLTVNGTVKLLASGDLSGPVAVNGLLDLGANDAAGTGTITLARGSVLQVEDQALVANAIDGLAAGGTIDLRGIGTTTNAQINGTSLVVTGTAEQQTLKLAGTGLTTANLILSSDGSGGTFVSYGPRTEAGAAFTNNINLGVVLVDSLNVAPLAVSNTASPGGERLLAAIGSLIGPVVAGGTLALAPGQGGALTVGMIPLSEGINTGTVDLAFISRAANRVDQPISGSVTVTSTAYALANPSATGSIDFGTARVGDAALAFSPVIANIGTVGDAYQESLVYAVTDPLDAAAQLTNASGTVAPGGAATVGVSLTGHAAGVVNDVALISETSRGMAGLADVPYGQSSLLLTGTLYNTATAAVGSALSFGIVHVGDVPMRSLVVSNTDNGGTYSDILNTAVGTITTGFTAGTAPTAIAGHSSGTLALGMDTSSAGVFTGTVTLGLTSSDAAQADLALASQTVALTGTVDNYATAALALAGGSGTLTGSGTQYTLDLGNIISPQTAHLEVLNTATGVADALTGYFTGGGGPAFSNNGFGSFSGLTAGQADTAPSITISPFGGDVSETLVLNVGGTNASGYFGALPAITLTVIGSMPAANSYEAASESDLNTILADINQGGAFAQDNASYTINLTGGSFALDTALVPINLADGASLTIIGNGATIDGGGNYQGFIDLSGALSLQNLTLANLRAQGGAGGSGPLSAGGGGAGLGGGLFVGSGASAILTDVSFQNDAARGGNGGFFYDYYRQGGLPVTEGGGGLDGGDGQSYGGGSSPIPGGQGAYGVEASGIGGGGSGGSSRGSGAASFGAGAGSLDESYATGNTPASVQGGFGGGVGYNHPPEWAGGGGLGAGADIFLQQGGAISFRSGTLGEGAVAGGLSGGIPSLFVNGDGSALGSAMFLHGGGTLLVAPGAGQTEEIDGSLASDQSGTLEIGGSGTVSLGTGFGFDTGGWLVAIDPGSTLRIAQTGNFGTTISGLPGGTIDAASVANGTVTLDGSVLRIANAATSLTVNLGESDLSYYGLIVSSDGQGGTEVTETVGQPPEALVTPVVQPLSIDFGNVHLGYQGTQTITVSNTLSQGGDTLVGDFGLLPNPLAAMGSLDLAPGQSGTLSVALNANVLGAFDVQAPLLLASQSPGGQETSIAGETVELKGAIFSYASPVVTVPQTSFGIVREGGLLTGTVRIGDGTDGSHDPSQEGLDYYFGMTSPNLTLSATSGTLASGQGVNIGMTLDSSVAGTINGWVPINFSSDGAGTSGLGTTGLPLQWVNVSGTVYAAATAAVTSSIDFGWTHAGTPLRASIDVANTATGDLTDTLSATISGITGNFASTDTGRLSAIGAGSDQTLDVAMQAGATGVQTGTASLTFVSHDPSLPDLNLVSGTVDLSGTVTNYATLAIQELSGGGTMSVNGNHYTVDLGAVSGPQMLTFGIVNTATGFADFLSGSFDAAGGADISASGLDAFSGLGAGQSDTAPTVTISPVVGGAFSETIVVHGTGSNAGGYSGVLADTTLTVVGTMAPQTYTVPSLVASGADLAADIQSFSAGGRLAGSNTHYVIMLDPAAGTLDLSGGLPSINLLAGSSLTIIGNGDVLNFGGTQRGFLAAAGSLDLQSLSIVDALAQGPNGGDGSGGDAGGGGGGGLGGGLFVGTGTSVTLKNVNFSNDAAVGGNGGAGGPAHSLFDLHLPGVGGDPGLPGGIGKGGAAEGDDGSFGGGGGGGIQSISYDGFFDGRYPGAGGTGAGAGGPGDYGVGGGGGGGAGLGADIFVEAGGNLSIHGGSLGTGTVAGGLGRDGGADGQGLGSTGFIQNGGTLALDIAAGQNLLLAAPFPSDGSGQLTLDGPGTLTLGSVTGFNGNITIAQGTLDLPVDVSPLTGTINDSGALVLDLPTVPTPTLVSTLANTGPLATDVIEMATDLFSDDGSVSTVSDNVAWTGSLDSFVSAFNTAAADFYNQSGLSLHATDNGNSFAIDGTGWEQYYNFQFFDVSGHLLENLGVAPGYYTYFGDPLVAGTLPAPQFDPTDSIIVDGTTVEVGGHGYLADLVNSLNNASIPGVSASLDANGHLQIDAGGAAVTVADGTGTVLEALGIAPGPHGGTIDYAGTITGTGNVVINQAAYETLQIGDGLQNAGTVTLNAGTLDLTGDVSSTGTIVNNGVLVFNATAANSFNGSITGAGEIVVTGGTLALHGGAGLTGNILLEGGDLLVTHAGAAGSGEIIFGSGSEVLVNQNVPLTNTLVDFGPSNAIDLAGFDSTSTAPEVVGTNLVQVSDTSGRASILHVDPTANLHSTIFLAESGSSGVRVVGVSTTISAGETVSITAGQAVSGMTVHSGGTLNLATGATASGTQISGGQVVVSSGASVIDTLVQSGGSLVVSSGGHADPTIVTSSSSETIQAGASDTGALISGGTQYVYGSAIATTIYTGSQVVESGGIAVGTVISGGTMEIMSGGVVNGAIDFAGSGGTLQIDDTQMPGVTISGLVAGDVIDLAGVAYDSTGHADLLAGNKLQITEGGQTYDLNLDPHQDFTGDYFHIHAVDAANPGAGTLVTEDTVPCYCAGTLISTARGEVPVEDLAIGDEVLTLSGEARPIKWIGRRSYRRPFMLKNVTPILIRAGALREHVPQRDLYVSPDHAMYIDEVLIAAEHLVNGVSIVRCHDVDSVQYFHIELERHDVIFAEGAPAETFVDCDNRLMFHNAAEFNELYPADGAPGWAFCAPRIEVGPRLERIRQAIAARAGVPQPDDAASCGPLEGSLDDATHTLINGWAFDRSRPGVPVWLEVLVDDGVVGRVLANLHRPDLAQDGLGTGHHGFALWLQHGLSPLAPHVVRVRRVADGSELPDSPRLIEPREGTSLVRSTELMPVLNAAAHAAPDVAALDAMLWSLQNGIDRVRQLRTERQMAQDAISDEPVALLAHANRRPQKLRRALVIDDRMPDPARDAGSNAILGHMRALIALGYQVEFVATQQMIGDTAPPRLPHGLEAVHWHQKPAVASVEEVLQRNAGAYELIYLHRLGNASAYAGLARHWCPRAHMVYSVADLHHLRLMRQARVLAQPKLMKQARAVKQAELFAMRTANSVITHSPAEAEYLSREAPGARVHVVGWPVEVSARNVPFARRSGVAFIGSPGHEPNRDAVQWLIEEIMPRVWERDPAIVCEIIGAEWPAIFPDVLDHRIWLAGSVPDLTTVFDRVRLTVAPLRFGAGMKGKVLDSFAAGVPCVMTPIAAEGLSLVTDLRGLVGQTCDDLADIIYDLHASEARNGAASAAGQDMVARDFSLAQIRSALRGAVARVVRCRSKLPQRLPALR